MIRGLDLLSEFYSSWIFIQTCRLAEYKKRPRVTFFPLHNSQTWNSTHDRSILLSHCNYISDLIGCRCPAPEALTLALSISPTQEKIYLGISRFHTFCFRSNNEVNNIARYDLPFCVIKIS